MGAPDKEQLRRLAAQVEADRRAEQKRRAPFVKDCADRFREGKEPKPDMPLDIVMEGWFIVLQEQRQEIADLRVAVGRIEDTLGMEE